VVGLSFDVYHWRENYDSCVRGVPRINYEILIFELDVFSQGAVLTPTVEDGKSVFISVLEQHNSMCDLFQVQMRVTQ